MPTQAVETWDKAAMTASVIPSTRGVLRATRRRAWPGEGRGRHGLRRGKNSLLRSRFALRQRGDDVAAKQVDRVHDSSVSQVAHLHETKDLVDAGLPILSEDLDDAGRVAHGEGARRNMG